MSIVILEFQYKDINRIPDIADNTMGIKAVLDPESGFFMKRMKRILINGKATRAMNNISGDSSNLTFQFIDLIKIQRLKISIDL